MGEGEGTVLRPLPPAEGRSSGHQRKVPIGLHAPHHRVLEGYRPPLAWTPRIHLVDQNGKLLSWAVGPAGPTPGVPPLDRGSTTQVAPIEAQRVLPGLI